MNNQNDKQHTPQNPLPPPYPYYMMPQEDEINLFGILKLLIEQKIIIIIFTIIFTLIALAYALLATPIYRAEALLAPVTNEKGGSLGALASQFGGLASLTGISLSGENGGIEEAIATLNSRELTIKFIEEENLMPVLFEDNWDKKNNKWIDVNETPTLLDAYNKFNKSIRAINQDKKSGLITLSIDWKQPKLAAEWVDKLIVRANKKLRGEAIQSADKSIKYLEAELHKTSVIEIKESIYSLIEAQTKTKMLANTQEEYAFRIIDKAVVPEERIKPKKIFVVAMGFMLGIVIGVFYSLIRQALISRHE